MQRYNHTKMKNLEDLEFRRRARAGSPQQVAEASATCTPCRTWGRNWSSSPGASGPHRHAGRMREALRRSAAAQPARGAPPPDAVHRPLMRDIRAIEQFDQCHRCVVSLTETHLQDTHVATIAIGKARPQLIKNLDDHFAITQTVKSQTAIGQAGLLSQGNHRLDHTAQFLGLGQSRLDGFMAQQRIRHVAEHRQAMRRSAVQLTQTITVTHDSSSGLCTCRCMQTGGYSLWRGFAQEARSKPRPAGGQFSSFMPSVRPREARTSLISLSDLRPRFGVFRSSFSVRWIRSPM
jgi:hypothetical protein